MIAIKFGYLGKCYAIFFSLAFIISYFKLEIHRILVKCLFALETIFLTFIFTNEYHKLYYSTYKLVKRPYYSYISITKGPIYIMFMCAMLINIGVYNFFAIKSVINSYGKERLKYILIKVQKILLSIELKIIILLIEKQF